jgi:hypothetical protein
MKINNRFQIANVKALFTKAATVAIVAGAAFMAAPQKANAQVAFGIQFGRPAYRRPVYVAPAPVYVQPSYEARYYAAPRYGFSYGYLEHRDRAWDRRREFERDHHDWDRDDRDRRDR